MAPEPAVASLLVQNEAYLRFDDASGLVVCKLTGHSMPATQVAVTQYIGGKKFQKLKKEHDEVKSFAEYEPYVVPSKYNSTKLFCRLTGCLIEKKEPALIRHSEGKKFIMEMDRVKKGACLKEEPDPEFAKRVAKEAKEREEAKVRERLGSDSDDDDDNEGEGDGKGGPWVPPGHVIDSDISSGEEDGEGAGESGSEPDGDLDDVGVAAAGMAGGGSDGEVSEPEILEVMQPRPRAKPSEAALKRKAAKDTGKGSEGGAAKRTKKEAPSADGPKAKPGKQQKTEGTEGAAKGAKRGSEGAVAEAAVPKQHQATAAAAKKAAPASGGGGGGAAAVKGKKGEIKAAAGAAPAAASKGKKAKQQQPPQAQQGEGAKQKKKK